MVLGSLLAYTVYATASVDRASVTTGTYRTYNFFASTTPATGTVSSTILSTTTTATSTNITAFMTSDGLYRTGALDITGAKKITMYFSRGGATNPNTGSTNFKIQVSDDGTNWYDYNRLLGSDVSATATSSAWITAATSTLIYGVDITNQSFQFLRCIVVETTDGEHACKASVNY